jgi:uncharacterized protein YcgI (DUF1989 family)
VHDTLNFFMHTGVDQNGRPFIASQTAKKGDYVDLLMSWRCRTSAAPM